MAKPKTILIVDDEYFLAEIIKVRLESIGYDTFTAENGVQALECLKKEKIDLVLMDVMMPIMDGWNATQAIKADESLKHIPVIMLTALGRHQDHLKADEVGADDYVTKPFEAADLVEKIKKWIKS
jgi:CheY-like chemotaxis protein